MKVTKRKKTNHSLELKTLLLFFTSGRFNEAKVYSLSEKNKKIVKDSFDHIRENLPLNILKKIPTNPKVYSVELNNLPYLGQISDSGKYILVSSELTNYDNGFDADKPNYTIFKNLNKSKSPSLETFFKGTLSHEFAHNIFGKNYRKRINDQITHDSFFTLDLEEGFSYWFEENIHNLNILTYPKNQQLDLSDQDRMDFKNFLNKKLKQNNGKIEEVLLNFYDIVKEYVHKK